MVNADETPATEQFEVVKEETSTEEKTEKKTNEFKLEPDTYETQDNKDSEYAKLLQFLESDAVKGSVVADMKVNIMNGEPIGLLCKINDTVFDVRNRRKTRASPNHQVVVVSGFTLDAGKEKLVGMVYRTKEEVTDENRDMLQQQLLSWNSIGALERFLPKSEVIVTNYSEKSCTVEVMIDGVSLSKVTSATVPQARHLAACAVLNHETYRETYLRAANKSYACINNLRSQQIDPEDRKIVSKMSRLMESNNLNKPSFRFDDDVEQHEVVMRVNRGGDDVEAAAANTLKLLSAISKNPQTKKNDATKRKGKKGQNGPTPKKFVDGPTNFTDAISYLNHVGMKNKSPAVYEISSEGEHGPFGCTVNCGGQTFTVNGIQSKKQAKAAAAVVAARQLCGGQIQF